MIPASHRPLEVRSVLDRLAFICGADHVRTLDNSALAVAPANANEISSILKFATDNHLTVEPRGSGSKGTWLEPAQHDLLLLTHRMTAVREHTWQDMTCTVEAGCPWSVLQASLAQHGQFVALDPLWPDHSTVGGIVAANDSGALRLRYGGLRDLIIGATVVLADGTIARSGGKVVKNVAGYDLPKLMCGSFGTLGIITEVNFRLHALPRTTVTITVTSPAADPLGAFLLHLLDSNYSAQSIQLRSANCDFALDVRLAALPGVVASQSDLLIAFATSMGLSAHFHDTNALDIWSSRQRQLESAELLHFKATMLPTDIAVFTQAVFFMEGTAVTQATGIMIGALPIPHALENITKLREQLQRSHGSLTILNQASDLSIERWGKLSSSLPLMREIKRQFDPKATLNPGRFVGGI